MLPPKLKLLLAISVALAILGYGCERKITESVTQTVEVPDYLGSAACQTCHSDIYADFLKTGHPYKLNDASDVAAGGHYPYSTVPAPPSGYTWDDVTYVIGGFWWKARFIGTDGYIITAGGNNQYNLADGSWADYHAGETKPYDCGPCHTTGYSEDGHQDGLEGIVGTWEEPGVQCEECHGPGSLHATSPQGYNMLIDRSAQSCGECHSRGSISDIPASGGFIKHHEQWNEMARTKHNGLECVDCHDPHKGLHASNPDRGLAIVSTCENCHYQEHSSIENSSLPHFENDLGCIDCHMPYAAKSALGDTTVHQGDVRSHLFRINTDATAELTSGSSANGYLTLDFSCLTPGCHASETKSWAASYAHQVHAPDLEDITSCFACHGDGDFSLVAAHGQWEHSKHASGDNIDRNRNYKSYYQSCEKCHTNEGFVAEVTGVPAVGDHFSAIGCFTCHAPHTGGNLELRVTEAVSLGNGATFDRDHANLCASCHQGRRNVDEYIYDGVELSSHWGPHHSNQADMLIGENAYEYAGYSYSNSAHTNVSTEGCLDCHMTASIGYAVGGHTFNMEDTLSGHTNTIGCNEAACHNGSVSTFNMTADDDYDWDGSTEGIQDEIHGLLDSLHVLLESAGLVDAEGEPIDGRVVGTADSAGAVFNYLFVEEDRSGGIHNTDHAVGLLQSSVNFMLTGSVCARTGESLRRFSWAR
ncbi:MAG: multiheme c-type cytochrome [Candidatus Zixiibacteriota bacterium]